LEPAKNIRQILLGNEAIACGLLESGCSVAASYPGTPASEILGTLVHLKRKHQLSLHLEWSINEKIAFEVGLANSYTGRRSAVIMKQVGLNVAADPLMSAAYTGVKGGFVLVVADDPGPHSSQTEQDSRFSAMSAKIPVLDPSSPGEARDFAAKAMELSERYELPVMLRPTTRVCHARQDLELRPFQEQLRTPLFEKNPARWAATPKFRLLLHRALNEKLTQIARDPEFQPVLVSGCPTGSAPARRETEKARSCIVVAGVVASYTQETLADLGMAQQVPLYQVPMPYPLSPSFREELLDRYDSILVLEESYPVIELQLQNLEKVRGRASGHVPTSGELLPEVVAPIIAAFLGLELPEAVPAPASPGRRPTLCAGCSHRAAFYAIKKAFPKGLYPSDIGCYTLGLNLGVVDTVLCMGASISQAAGFYHAFRGQQKEAPAICATIGDSTFFHAGIPALLNAVVQDARFVLVILDNSTTAMTGHQPTPALGKTLEGTTVPRIELKDLVKACGVRFVAETDPYCLDDTIELLRKAKKHAHSKRGGIAVVIAKHPCIMDRRQPEPGERLKIRVNDQCKGCLWCVQQFECPALQSRGRKQKITLDDALCSGCGVCIDVCPHGAIEKA
jgi:indolepyruvate ferredoxin oxidoreductase, alpha subunit